MATGSITGLVVGADDKALKGIPVSIEGMDDTPTPAVRTVTTIELVTGTTPEVNFTFPGLNAASSNSKYRVTFPEYVPLPAAGTGYNVLVSTGVNGTSQTITLTNGDPNRVTKQRKYETQALVIRGKVTDDQKRPLIGIPVFLQPEDITDDATKGQLTQKARSTAPNGEYRFTGLVNAKYTVSFLKELLYRDPSPGKPAVLIRVQAPATGRVEVVLDGTADGTEENAEYLAGGGSGVPPEVVFQATGEARDIWDAASKLLTEAVVIAEGAAGYVDQLCELADTAAMEAAWYHDVQLNVTVDNAPDLFVTLAYRALEKQAVIRGRVRGLVESIDQAIRPPPAANAAQLLTLRTKLLTIAAETDKLDDAFPL